MTYGVQPTGYVRKPLSVILQEIEDAMVTEFGPGVVQTSQSPLGQINGMMADLMAEIDERNLDLYQSYDPNQADGNRLDMLGRIRLVSRNAETDEQYRQAVTNEGQARVDVQDLLRAVKNVDGVTYVQVFVNEAGEVTNYGLESGSISVAVIGGDDSEIASVMRKYVVPGINTFGNTQITSTIDGFCRSVAIIRPVEVPVALDIKVETNLDSFGCPPPSTVAIRDYLVEQWAESRINGKDASYFSIRSIIESAFSNIEVKSVTGARDTGVYPINAPVPIGFTEIAEITADNVLVSVSE